MMLVVNIPNETETRLRGHNPHERAKNRSSTTVDSRKKRPSFSAIGHHGRGRARNDKLINAQRRAEPLGPAWVDDTIAITPSLVNEVFHRAMCLETIYSKPDGSEESYFGQMGLIRGERPPSSLDTVNRLEAKRRKPSASSLVSCFKATPHTALHNVLDEEDETYKRVMVHCAHRSLRTSAIAFPDGGAGQVLAEADVVGISPATVAVGETLGDSKHFMTRKSWSYNKIPDVFELKAGLKIGIAVYRTFEITAEDTSAAAGVDVTKTFGKKNLVCVYTGEITQASRESVAFQHSINTFCGCSGAIVFLLDQNQPDEAKQHAGKAIGVHSISKKNWETKTL